MLEERQPRGLAIADLETPNSSKVIEHPALGCVEFHRHLDQHL